MTPCRSEEVSFDTPCSWQWFDYHLPLFLVFLFSYYKGIELFHGRVLQQELQHQAEDGYTGGEKLNFVISHLLTVCNNFMPPMRNITLFMGLENIEYINLVKVGSEWHLLTAVAITLKFLSKILLNCTFPQKLVNFQVANLSSLLPVDYNAQVIFVTLVQKGPYNLAKATNVVCRNWRWAHFQAENSEGHLIIST